MKELSEFAAGPWGTAVVLALLAIMAWFVYEDRFITALPFAVGVAGFSILAEEVVGSVAGIALSCLLAVGAFAKYMKERVEVDDDSDTSFEDDDDEPSDEIEQHINEIKKPRNR